MVTKKTGSCNLILIQWSATSGASRSQASGWRMARSARALRARGEAAAHGVTGVERGLLGGRGK